HARASVDGDGVTGAVDPQARGGGVGVTGGGVEGPLDGDRPVDVQVGRVGRVAVHEGVGVDDEVAVDDVVACGQVGVLLGGDPVPVVDGAGLAVDPGDRLGGGVGVGVTEDRHVRFGAG